MSLLHRAFRALALPVLLILLWHHASLQGAAAAYAFVPLSAIWSGLIELVESGDAGFWDAETEPKVIAARAALLKASPQEKADG